MGRKFLVLESESNGIYEIEDVKKDIWIFRMESMYMTGKERSLLMEMAGRFWLMRMDMF